MFVEGRREGAIGGLFASPDNRSVGPISSCSFVRSARYRLFARHPALLALVALCSFVRPSHFPDQIAKEGKTRFSRTLSSVPTQIQLTHYHLLVNIQCLSTEVPSFHAFLGHFCVLCSGSRPSAATLSTACDVTSVRPLSFLPSSGLSQRSEAFLLSSAAPRRRRQDLRFDINAIYRRHRAREDRPKKRVESHFVPAHTHTHTQPQACSQGGDGIKERGEISKPS